MKNVSCAAGSRWRQTSLRNIRDMITSSAMSMSLHHRCRKLNVLAAGGIGLKSNFYLSPKGKEISKLTRCAVPTGHSLAPTLDRLQTSATSSSSKRSSPIPPQSLRPIGIQRRSPTPALRFRLPLLTSRCMERITVCSLGCKTSSIIVVHNFRVCGQSHYSSRSPWTRS
jgi:hypothetical protein